MRVRLGKGEGNSLELETGVRVVRPLSPYLHIPAECVCACVCDGRGRVGILIVTCQVIG